MQHPIEVQEELLMKLIHSGKSTEWGKKYKYGEITSTSQFTERVPINTYEQLFPYIDRVMKGEQNVLWPSEIKWFAKSSGTTNDRSKFIPVSPEALEDCHYKGGKDLLALYVNNNPESKIFTGKSLSIGGSYQANTLNKEFKSHYGDVSAVIMSNLPMWAQFFRTPPLDIALLDNWEVKIEAMANAIIPENITSISGVPTWTLVLLKRVLEITGKKNMFEVWPDIELFMHGAVAFGPYRQLFKNLFPSEHFNYLETYNASEGFFGIQDQPGSEELLLMLDYGVYYEFIPIEDVDQKDAKAISLSEVQLWKNYAMVITTNAGLWRYKIGDTVKFTSISPYRIKITGRTKHFINAFGEELVVENAETGIERACAQTGATVGNFTAAPIYMGNNSKGGHEWIIEFIQQPSDLQEFTRLLDYTIREINSDYDAKRFKDIALQMPYVHNVPEGTFYNWMKKRGKLGGQNKVPRLANTREYVDDILTMMRESTASE